VALVTGGAGAIGGAVATRLVECGATVFSLDRPGQHPPQGVRELHADVCDPAAVTAAIESIDRDAGRLDVVIHAAGISRDGRLWKLTAVDWTTVLETNLTSAFHVLHAAVPVMRRAGRGSVVLISSINGERGKIGLSAYAASKGGLNALARTAARELGGFGIRVNAVAPGWIDTPMTATVAPDVRARAIEDTVLRRAGTPDDVARVVVWLAGGLASHVTGQVIRVDGGQLIG
jgi:acetoacetyl-CoA reductase/3-oxoacyl-[acyl-carrier protein] reductase